MGTRNWPKTLQNPQNSPKSTKTHNFDSFLPISLLHYNFDRSGFLCSLFFQCSYFEYNKRILLEILFFGFPPWLGDFKLQIHKGKMTLKFKTKILLIVYILLHIWTKVAITKSSFFVFTLCTTYSRSTLPP